MIIWQSWLEGYKQKKQTYKRSLNNNTLAGRLLLCLLLFCIMHTESVEFNTNIQNLGRGSLRYTQQWSILLNANVGACAQSSKDKKVGSSKWCRLAVSPVF